ANNLRSLDTEKDRQSGDREWQRRASWPLGRSETRKRVLDHKAGGYLIFAKIFSISSRRKARMVCVLTLPNEPSFIENTVTAASSGASSTSTTSYAPMVQNESLTLMPIFSASAVAEAAR